MVHTELGLGGWSRKEVIKKDRQVLPPRKVRRLLGQKKRRNSRQGERGGRYGQDTGQKTNITIAEQPRRNFSEAGNGGHFFTQCGRRRLN